MIPITGAKDQHDSPEPREVRDFREVALHDERERDCRSGIDSRSPPPPPRTHYHALLPTGHDYLAVLNTFVR